MPLHRPIVRGTAQQERVKRISRALANPAYFGEIYCRPFDAHWETPLPRFAHEMLAFAMSTRRGVVILPPEFAKTTLLSQVFPLWLTFRATCTGKLLRGMLLSEEEGMAVNNLSVIKWHIEQNQELQADFADAQGRPIVRPHSAQRVWREDSIIVSRSGTSKDPTWQAKGLDSTGIQGRRLDWLIGDDVITPANAFSPAKRDKALRDWQMAITTRLVKDGRALILGNFNDPHDLVSTLESNRSYKTFKRPAIHAKDKPEEPRDLSRPDAIPLWPEVWPIERLRREKEEKPQRFQRIFLLNATSERGEKLRTDWVTLIPPEATPFRECKFFIGIDPAPGGESHDLDFFNITVGALHEMGFDIVESFDFRASTPRQIELLGAFHDRYDRMGRGVIAIGGPKVALDRYFVGAISVPRPDLAAKVEPISMPGAKVERLEALGPYAQSGWLRVQHEVWTALTSDPEDQHQEISFHDQWKDFPLARHDDKLDGVDCVVRTARTFGMIDQSQEVDLVVLE
jgi:hypothetical protein